MRREHAEKGRESDLDKLAREKQNPLFTTRPQSSRHFLQPACSSHHKLLDLKAGKLH